MRTLTTLGRAAAFVIPLLAFPLAAQQQPAFRDSLLDRLAGSWVLRGTIGGQSTTHDVTAEWVLGHQYLHLHEISHERKADGSPEYEADAYIGRDPKSHQYTCVWLDVYGALDPHSVAYATAAHDSIPFAFHEADGSDFNTTFAYNRAADSWTMNMDAGTPGKMTPFARTTLTHGAHQ